MLWLPGCAPLNCRGRHSQCRWRALPPEVCDGARAAVLGALTLRALSVPSLLSVERADFVRGEGRTGASFLALVGLSVSGKRTLRATVTAPHITPTFLAQRSCLCNLQFFLTSSLIRGFVDRRRGCRWSCVTHLVILDLTCSAFSSLW